ncbi:LysR substrate-binding domain-containing protein [Variovorax sp. J22G73]|uniref:LysR substrate-binding domain-containing protein n=1 Tax=unclassified Variovorax TaxID=663243 RepID=UPI0025775D7A|nr:MULTISPECIES: LysR substrate-binding domain-containing protein [unclassified Variovorax]MDM0009392.1 LysR substrate-binding domain-containing protein [Variovorax sp. J22R203]MDM0101899.1 LysR substrate-binding domain-containing protein [Variovorax sp. J22G73]
MHQARRDVGYVWPLRQGAGKPRGYLVDPVVVASDPALLHDALCGGVGISLAMERSMAADVKARRLVRVLPQWVGPPQELNALSSRERMPSPKVQAFISYLKEHLTFESGSRSLTAPSAPSNTG